ncbi:TPA: hypothetical protein SMI01_002695 [Serratia marcescens]|nr:hypothetical protein [Serratia marcescens]
MTLTTETIKLWRNNAGITAGETAEDDPEHIAAKAILALTAEIMANREAQPVAYFAAAPDYGWDMFKNKEDAIATCQAEIDAYRDCRDDGWDDDVQRVCWGVVMQKAEGFDLQGLHTSNSNHTYQTCDYSLHPVTATAPPAPAVPDDYQHLKNVQELYHKQEERLFALAQRIKGVSFDKYSHTTAQAIDVLEREIFGDDGDACRAAMLAQPVSSGYKFNSPVIPDGWKLVPVEPTEDMIAAAMNCDDVSFNADETFCVNFGNIYAAMLAAATEGGNGA